jgi:FkbM family methyltransferase
MELPQPPWVIQFKTPGDARLGIQVRHVQSGNDGDVCNSCVTRELLNTGKPAYCLDIGVDEGWWSFFAADSNPLATVVGFEPNPISFEQLKRYPDPRITFHNVALSDRVGVLELSCEGGTSHTRGGVADTKTVICVPIDSYIGDRYVDCVKIDTEGHDLIVLRSMYPYLEQIGSIIFEFTVHWYGDNGVHESMEALHRLRSAYPYMYFMNRRGPPLLTEITRDDILEIVEFCDKNRFQVDILVTRSQIKTVPIRR